MKARLFSLFVAVFLALALSASAESRLALLIGVGKLGSPRFPDLPGIDQDLKTMSDTLKQLGFEVTVVADPTLGQAEEAIDNFGAQLKVKKGVGLFYFSGHGGEYEGRNYLIPRNARIGDMRDVKEQAVAAQRVLNRMESSGDRVNIVFLDCCRNDMTKAATDSGLAAMNARGTFIGFATASEKTSAASTEGSPYTQVLAKNLKQPGVSILDMHTQVTAEVQEITKAAGVEQTPYSYSGLTSSFYFVDKGANAPARQESPPVAMLETPKTPAFVATPAPVYIPPHAFPAATPTPSPVPPFSTPAGNVQSGDESWMAPLLPVDKDRIRNMPASREKALTEASAGDAAQVQALTNLMRAPAIPLDLKSLSGSWRVRTYELGGGVGIPLNVTSFFECRIRRANGKLAFEKSSGSIRRNAHLDPIDGNRLLLYDAYYASGDQPRDYGVGDDYNNEVGILEQVSKDRLRIEMPEPRASGQSHHDVLELIRVK